MASGWRCVAGLSARGGRAAAGLLMVGLLSWGMAFGQAASGVGGKEPVAFADEPLVVEHLETVYRYAADGTGSKRITVRARVQTDSAAREYGVLTVPFAGSEEKVQIDSVEVRHADGTTTETPAADAMEMPQPVTQAAPFYSDLKMAQIPVRSLRVGDRLEYAVTIVRTRPQAAGSTGADGGTVIFGQQSFVSNVVVLEEVLELHFSSALRMTVRGPETGKTVTETGGERVYRWVTSQKQATVGTDKDGKKPAAKAVDPEGTLASVAWTSFPSWEAVGAWYRRMEGDRMQPDAAVRAKAAELTAGKATEEEKARALYHYVATQIRYVGVAFGVGRYQPHAAGEVLGNQYGDCKDKHTLLASLLIAAGFKPDAALIGAGVRFDEGVPSPASFNHLITQVAVKNAAGVEQTSWLDSTAEVAPYRMLVSVLRDKRALVIPESGVAQVERTPAVAPFKPFTTFSAKGTIDTTGTTHSHMVYATRGDDEILLRALVRALPPAKWGEFAQQFSMGVGFGGTTSHAEVEPPDRTEVPWTIAYDYVREKPGDWENYRIIPQMPTLFLLPVDEKNPPTMPIDLGLPRVETATAVLTLPEGWGAELPAAVHQKAEFAAFDKTYTIEKGVLTTVRRLEILQPKIPVEAWKSYKAWTEGIDLGSETFVQLVRTVPKAGEKGPPLAGSNDAEAAGMVKEAYDEIQRGEVNKAKETLDAAAKRNAKQEYLWSTYGYLAFERKDFAAAVTDYRKELELYPEATRVYPSIGQAQVNLGRVAEATATMRTAHAASPDDLEVTHFLAGLEGVAGHYDDAATLLDGAVAKHPGDQDLVLERAAMELKGSRKKEGAAVMAARLTELLDGPTEEVPAEKLPGRLNDYSYELGESGQELGLAEKGARRAVELLTKETVAAKEQTGAMSLLVATWDTLGWVLAQEGTEEKLEEAYGTLRAAFTAVPRADEAMHLGVVEERRGQMKEAMATYAMGEHTAAERNGKVETAQGKALLAEFQRRMEGLQAKGVTRFGGDAGKALQELRTLPLGRRSVGKGGLLREYTVAMESGGVVSTVPDDAEGSMVRRARVAQFFAPGSEARMVRKGLLNCYSGTCELVLLPW